MTASDFFFFSPQKYSGCLPTSLWQDLCNAHTESSDTEPETRKIFTCVEEVNKCSLFTYWDQSHPPVLDLKACGGGGWMRWDEGRLSATWRRGTFRCIRMENAGGTVRSTRSFERNRSTPQWTFGQKVNEDTLHPEQTQENRQMSVFVSLHAYRLNHLCVHSVLMNLTQKRALKSSLILAVMFLHID